MAFYRARVDEDGNELNQKQDILGLNSATYINPIPVSHSNQLYTRAKSSDRLPDIFAQGNDDYSLNTAIPARSPIQSGLKSCDTTEYVESMLTDPFSSLHITMQSNTKSRVTKGYTEQNPRSPPNPYHSGMQSNIIPRDTKRYTDQGPTNSPRQYNSNKISRDIKGFTEQIPRSHPSQYQSRRQPNLISRDNKRGYSEQTPRSPPSPYHSRMQSNISHNTKGFLKQYPSNPLSSTMKSGIKSPANNRYIETIPASATISVCPKPQSGITSSVTNGNNTLTPRNRTSTTYTNAQSNLKLTRSITTPNKEFVTTKPTTYLRRLSNKYYKNSTDEIRRDANTGLMSESLHNTNFQSCMKSPHLISHGRGIMATTPETPKSPHYTNKLSEKKAPDLKEDGTKPSIATMADTHSDSLKSLKQSDKKSLDFIAHVKRITNDGSITSVYPTSSSDDRQTGRTDTQDLDSLDIPSLDLKSNDEWTTRTSARIDATFTVDRCDPQEAFQNWLKAKNAQKDKERKLMQIKEAKKRENEQIRKVESKVKVQQWKERKRIEKAAEIAKRKLLLEKTQKSEVQIKKTNSNVKVMEWEYTKMQQAVQKKQMEKAELELKRAQEEMRRERAAEAWNKWITDAKNKPKPVPLNRGLESLRGSLSQTYINPNEWQT